MNVCTPKRHGFAGRVCPIVSDFCWRFDWFWKCDLMLGALKMVPVTTNSSGAWRQSTLLLLSNSQVLLQWIRYQRSEGHHHTFSSPIIPTVKHKHDSSANSEKGLKLLETITVIDSSQLFDYSVATTLLLLLTFHIHNRVVTRNIIPIQPSPSPLSLL